MEYNWKFSTIHDCSCRVIEERNLWGQHICTIWLPDRDIVASVLSSDLRPLNSNLQADIEANRIKYVSSGAKIAQLLEGESNSGEGHVLLAPMESSVIPLPHQIYALSRAVSSNQIRYLLADEVGLGKTIEAGLIMRELKLRGLVRRTLVVAPKGLAAQWVSEMQFHFHEEFKLILGDDIDTLQRIASGIERSSTPWTMFNQVVVSLDSVKPMDKRRGWTEDRVAQYNSSRFEDLVTAGWDLVIVDEAHRLSGSNDQVARYKLGKSLTKAAPYVLLLSATPHQGKTDAFHRLMNLLDEEAFPNLETVSRDRVAPYLIRTEKRLAIDSDGKPLFKPRQTQMVLISWEVRHNLQRLLYEEVTDYVRDGYNQAISEKKRHISFLMILMQRLVVSSTRAIRTTLERRLETLHSDELQLDTRMGAIETKIEATDDIYDIDAQELLDGLLNSNLLSLQNEVANVEKLLETARKCEETCMDAKAEALLEWIYKLQADESDADLKILIFTEFVSTLEMIRELLESNGISVTVLNGSMGIDERKRAQEEFCSKVRVLISTDAGGEGLNLQFCHIVINYDIPWNPMRLEQRVGRVDRIGQPKTVRAFNFILEESVEFRVLDVLEQKLSIIFKEFGIDKTGDILDSSEAGNLFESVYTSAILNPSNMELFIENTVSKIKEQIREVRKSSLIFSVEEKLNVDDVQGLRSHPLPHWIERMTVAYLNAHGGQARRKRSWWELKWPSGTIDGKSVFKSRDLEQTPDAALINFEDKRIRHLVYNLPQFHPGQSLPVVALNALPTNVSGFWGLFEIRLYSSLIRHSRLIRVPMMRRNYFCVFLNGEGRMYIPTANYIWDALQTNDPKVLGNLGLDESKIFFDRLVEAATEVGHESYNNLREAHLASIVREEQRGNVFFSYQKQSIENVGLPEVRHYRLSRLNEEEANWYQELEYAKQSVPEMRPLLLMRILRGGNNELER